MDFELLGSSHLNDTKLYAIRDELGELRVLVKHWNPSTRDNKPNCYYTRISNTNESIQEKLEFDHRPDLFETCHICHTNVNKFLKIPTCYIELPNYFRKTHKLQVLCTDCAEKPKETFLQAPTELSEHLTIHKL